jgi:hypothetical protein
VGEGLSKLLLGGLKVNGTAVIEYFTISQFSGLPYQLEIVKCHSLCDYFFGVLF